MVATDAAAAGRGDELFSGTAGSNSCHVEALWGKPGWNLHPPADVCIDDFEANRAPDGVYETMNLNGLFGRENGLFMNRASGLSDSEKRDLVEYLKSLPERK